MILCDVNNFKLNEPINKTEEKYFAKGIRLKKLQKQHNEFIKALHKNNIYTTLIQSEESCPEQVFVRDVAFKVDNVWCICNMATNIRRPETKKFKEYLESCGKKFYQLKSTVEGGDILIWNQTIFIGIGSRTDNEAVNELSEMFKDYDIVPIKLTKDVLHLDCVFNIVNDNNAVIYKEGIDKKSYAYLNKIFNLIEISPEEQENMATNFIKFNEVVFCEKHNKRVNFLIRNLGLKVEEVDFNEFHKLGGSLRCCCLDYSIHDYTHKKYLYYKENSLHYKDIDLYSLVKKYGDPLKVGYPDLVKEKIRYMKSLFHKCIKNNNYSGQYFYANANKASYYAENVISAGTCADFYETSSAADLAIVERVLSKKIVNKKKIICNGIKDDEYISLIFKMIDNGYEILNIIDNIDEFKKFVNHSFKNNVEIGLRVKLKSIYSKNKKVAKYERFGLYPNEIDYIIKEYKNNDKIKLTTIHYHQRGSAFDKAKFIKSLSSAFEAYANAVKQDNSIINLNIGGGCPYSKTGEYNYAEFVEIIINNLKHLSKEYGVKEPNIIQENGRYTVSDSCFNIYKITNVKDDTKPWYIVNDSFMTSLPNTWALGEDFLILPINLIENKMIPVRLAGNTCDGDDVYYYQSKQEFMLPQIKEGQTLYIGIFGMGAYQEILSGIGGIHHCLNREENDLIIYRKNSEHKFYHVRKAQTIKYLFKRLLYKDKKTMDKFN